jgi:hypothetical protein
MKLIVILLCLIILIISLSNIYIYYGIKRPRGPKGSKGIKGDIGSLGIEGDIGEEGIAGYRGPIGIKGKDIGLKGGKGKQGIKGFKGEAGDIGRKGLMGDKGVGGPPGIQGDRGFKGKKGLEGPLGRSRVISDLSPINLIADRRKCVKIDAYNKNGDGIDKELEQNTSFKCPKNMVVFDIRAKKVSDRTADSNIDNIVCCNMVMDPLYGDYFNKTKMLDKLLINLGTLKTQIAAYKSKYIQGNMWHQYLKGYNEEDISKITYNIEKMLNLLSGIQSFKSIREMPYEVINKYYKDEESAKLIKEYTEEEEANIKEMSDSITSYEYYILNLILGLFKMNAASIDTSDYKRFVKEVYDFPKNDIVSLEEAVNYLN